jgi:hypothetical protein
MSCGAVKIKQAAWAALVLVLLLETLGEAHALALRGPSAEMLFEDLPLVRAPGAGRPTGSIKLANTGDEPIEVLMRLALTGPGMLKDGYESARDPSWARLARPRLKIPPGKEAESALLVGLPPDPSLSGGRFQLEWIGEASAASGARLELRSRVLMNVETDGAKLLSARRRARGKGQVQFSLSPPEGRLDNVPLGRKVDLQELGLKVKVVNQSQNANDFGMSLSIDTLDSKKIEEGFAPAPNPDFLKPASPVVSVASDSVGEARFSLEIPDQGRYRGRAWVFFIHVDPLQAGEGSAKDFRLFVKTAKGAAM